MKADLQTGKSNRADLSHFLNLRKLLGENRVILSYCGEVSQPLTNTLLAFTERKLSEEELEDLVKKKIFNIMVEMLQNISKNALENTPEITPASPMFALGENDDHVFLISVNKIHNDQAGKISERIDEVNALDAAGQKALYKERRLKGKFSELAGAGIGFIDMARKSGNKLQYGFATADNENLLYTLLIKVNKTLNQNK